MDEFKLGKPVVVCRWRLAKGKLPLENRHLRALAARRANGKPVPNALVAWAKQHIEWTLQDGSFEYPDGVLMLVIDEDGKAAMSVGDYVAPARTTANDLLRRAQGARKEAEVTGVSPEDLWAVRGDVLLWSAAAGCGASGASSLIFDLATTLGMSVQKDEALLQRAAEDGFTEQEVFLVSDEHGVVPASDRAGDRAHKFAASYVKLLAK